MGTEASSLGNRDRLYSLGTLDPGPEQMKQQSPTLPPGRLLSCSLFQTEGCDCPLRWQELSAGGYGSRARHSGQPSSPAPTRPPQNVSPSRDSPTPEHVPEWPRWPGAPGAQSPPALLPSPACPPPHACQLPAGLAPNPVTVSATAHHPGPGLCPCSRHSRTAPGTGPGLPTPLKELGSPGSAPLGPAQDALPDPASDARQRGREESDTGTNTSHPRKDQGLLTPQDPTQAGKVHVHSRPWVPGGLVLALMQLGAGSSGRGRAPHRLNREMPSKSPAQRDLDPPEKPLPRACSTLDEATTTRNGTS